MALVGERVVLSMSSAYVRGYSSDLDVDEYGRYLSCATQESLIYWIDPRSLEIKADSDIAGLYVNNLIEDGSGRIVVSGSFSSGCNKKTAAVFFHNGDQFEPFYVSAGPFESEATVIVNYQDKLIVLGSSKRKFDVHRGTISLSSDDDFHRRDFHRRDFHRRDFSRRMMIDEYRENQTELREGFAILLNDKGEVIAKRWIPFGSNIYISDAIVNGNKVIAAGSVGKEQMRIELTFSLP